MAGKKEEQVADPTVTSDMKGPAYPEGTHPAPPASETSHSATRIEYRDNPDKPDPSSIAQVADIPEDFPGQ